MKNKTLIKIITILVLIFIIFSLVNTVFAGNSSNQIVIVINPGHGREYTRGR